MEGRKYPLDKVQFYNRIDALLLEKNWSRNRLATESKIPKSTIYNMMQKKNEPKIETFFKIIEGFHMSIDEFIDPSSGKRQYTAAQIEILNATDGMNTNQIDRVLAYTMAVSQEPKKN